jgi:RNA polymerase sigma-70 factor (ECF subfamily)
LERDRQYVVMEDADAAGKELVSGDNPLGELARNETIESVRRAVLALPAAYREAVVLCDLSEMSYAEAARVMGCPEGTVRSRLHRARTLLAERLREPGRNKVSRCAV